MNCSSPMKIMALTLAVAGQIAQANPNSQNSEYLHDVSLQIEDGIYTNTIILKNSATDKHIDSLNVTAQSSHIDIEVGGMVSCQKDKGVDYTESKIYFGPAYLFVDSVVAPKALYDKEFYPSYRQWVGVSGWGDTESGDSQPFSVPLNSVKSGDAAIRFNPIEELNKELQVHLNLGGSKIDFYKKDHIISVERPVTLVGTCRDFITNSQQRYKSGYDTKMVELTVKYEGDPNLNKVGALNAKLGGNLPQEINQNLPMILNSATFQPNMPHHIGQCPAKQDPELRINFKGAGEGQVRFMVYDGSTNVYGSPALSFNSKNSGGKGHHDFTFPFNAKYNVTQAWKQINKTINHPLKIRAQIKDKNAVTWGSWANYGQATWKHRCTPTTQFGTPGSLGGYDNGAANNKGKLSPLNLKKGAVTPKRAPAPQPTRIKRTQ